MSPSTKNLRERIELWKPIKGYEGRYEVSSHGRVRSLEWWVKSKHGSYYLKKGRVMRFCILPAGYLIVSLSKEDGGKTLRVSRLVAEAFVPNPLKKPWVNHLDSNRINNRASNLEWCTPRENTMHAYKSGNASQKGSRNARAKLTEDDVLKIRSLAKMVPIKELAKRFKVVPSVIENIIARRAWKHI